MYIICIINQTYYTHNAYTSILAYMEESSCRRQPSYEMPHRVHNAHRASSFECGAAAKEHLL